jgi:adenylate cyclase
VAGGGDRRQQALGLGAGLLAAVVTTLAIGQLGVSWDALEERVQGALLRRAAHNLRARLPAREREAVDGALRWSPRVQFVDLDEETYAALGRPIPRAVFAEVLDALTAAGASAVAFDLVFQRGAHGPEDDALFGAALARSGLAVMAVDCYVRVAHTRPLTTPLVLPPGPTGSGQCSAPGLPLYTDGVVLAHVQFPNSAAAYEIETWPLMTYGEAPDFPEQRLLSLSAAAWALANGVHAEDIRQTPTGLQIAGVEIPIRQDGAIRVSFRGRDFNQTRSVVDLHAHIDPVTHRFDAEYARRYEKAFVVVGTSNDIDTDLSPFATGVRYPSALHHVAFLSDLVEGRFMHTLPQSANLAIVALLTLLMSAVAIWQPPGRGLLAVLALVLVVMAVSLQVLQQRLVVAPLGMLVTSIAAWMGATITTYSLRERQRRLIQDAFGAYVDGTVLQRILKSSGQVLALGGARKEVTVMFTDIAGFTALTNRLAPEEIIDRLREYLGEMTRLITARGGRVDKIMGDGIMAVFGDPIPQADHARQATLVASEMLAAVGALSQRWAAQGRDPLDIRIGLATGEVFVGDIGAKDSKLEYTVLGAVVNLASRLEGKAPLGTALVSAATAAANADTFDFAEVGSLQLKGFTGAQKACLLLGARRDGPRREARLPLGVRVPVVVIHGEQRMAGAVTDASTGGLFVHTELSLPLGTEVLVEFATRPARLAMVVRRTATNGLGLERRDETQNVVLASVGLR